MSVYYSVCEQWSHRSIGVAESERHSAKYLLQRIAPCFGNLKTLKKYKILSQQMRVRECKNAQNMFAAEALPQGLGPCWESLQWSSKLPKWIKEASF